MGKKIFIFHLKEPDSDSLPYGKYFIDEETKKLYVSPIDKEKWEALEKSYERYSYMMYISGPVVAVFGGRISMSIAQISRLENSLLLLACVVALYAIFFYFKKKHSKMVNQLLEETGYRIVECEDKEEADYLEEIAKHWKKLMVACASFFVLTCIFGYAAVMLIPMIPAGFAIVLFLLTLVPAIFFTAFSLVLNNSLGAVSAITRRLTILKENKND